VRVLAIRGYNLASLPELEVVLDQGPLAETGLFAISGPTGAGKTTLLDAMCLALYDQTPRLLGQRELPVGGAQAHAADPRSVLRRGTGEGRAEVDFEGQNGRFRAIWAVRRAKKKAEGKLQPQEMALYRLPDLKDLSGGTKTETLRRIEAEVGLSFDEFRRAVLLAQGDFAAFLEARPDQRAELLEKMTGTALYGELSRAAFQRAKDEANALEQLLEAQAAIAPLSAEQRRAKEADRSAAEESQQTAKTSAETLRAQVAQNEAQARLSIERREAEQALAEAEVALSAQTERYAWLKEARRFERLRPKHEAQIEARNRAQNAGAALALAESQLLLAQEEREQTQNVAAARARAVAALRAEAERIAPELAEARTLDVELREAELRLREVEEELAEQHHTQAERTARATRRREQKNALTQRLAETQAWLGEHEASRALAAQWSRWSTELERLVEARAEASAIGVELRQSTAQAEAAQAEEQAIRAELAASQAAVKEAQGRTAESVAQLEASQRHLSPLDVQTSLERLAKERSSLQALGTALKEAARLERQLLDDERQERSASAEQKQTRGLLEVAKQKKRQTEEKLKEVAQALEALEATEALSARRDELLALGQPCPLCGATEHPAAAHPTEKNPRLSVLRGQRTRLEGVLAQATEEQQALEVTLAQAQDQAKAAGQRRVHNGQALLDRQQIWQRGHEQLALLWSELRVPTPKDLVRLRVLLPERPDPKTGPGGVAAADQLLLEIQNELRAYAAADEVARATVEIRRREEDRAEEVQRRVLERLEKHRDRQQEAHQGAAQLRIQSEVVQVRAKDAETALVAAFERWPNWQEALSRDPVAFRKSASLAVEDWEAKAALERGLIEDLRSCLEADAVGEAELLGGAQQLERTQELVSKRRERRATLAQARSQRLGGQAVEPYEAQQRLAIGAAEAEAQAARTQAERTALKAAAAEERLLAGQESKATAEREKDAVEREYQTTLRELGLEEGPELRDYLATSNEQIQAAEAALQVLHEARARAEATALDRRARLLALPQADPRPLPELRTSLFEAEQAHAKSLVTLGRLTAELHQDDQLLSQRSALEPKLRDQAAATEAWLEISSVIGSADGKKLRTFAQSLSLEALINAANRHLHQLRPRYRLERIPTVDMELLVVDRDLGDEARAISSLSGGETFLVSLSLALGLASLSAKDVRLGSLFIDEGFGSLDKEALELAISALDQLQAEGRTVGLISHIPDLAERIGYVVEVRPIGPGTSKVEVRRS
jgi:exonuclease SbcC